MLLVARRPDRNRSTADRSIEQASAERRVPAGSPRRRVDHVLAVGGLCVTAVGMLLVAEGTVPAWERQVFLAINGLPDWLYRPLWPVQQLGGLIVGPIVALVALALRRYRLAAAAVLATVGKLLLEAAVKGLVDRQRPASSVGGEVIRRGVVSYSGKSFVSGHALLATALVTLVVPQVPARWRPVPLVLLALLLFTRVYVGAHNPLDVLCGAALGAALGGVLNLAFKLPERAAQAAEAKRLATSSGHSS